MNSATTALLEQKVAEIETLPAMPAVLYALGEILSGNPSEADVDRIVELISYDKALAAQCIQVANSALFGRRVNVQSVRGAVLALGMRRIRDLVYSCSLPKMFGITPYGIAAHTFWCHALGTALVGQRLGARIGMEDTDKLYLAGLLHDIGLLVNALLFQDQFQRVLETAQASETPLYEVERQVLGFSHCNSGRILADKWRLPPDISGVIEHHHEPSPDDPDAELVSVVYLADLLCRFRNLGYGYYEARVFDLASEGPWRVLQQKYPGAARMDLARFTFELDQYAVEVRSLVHSIFADGGAKE